MDLHWAPLSVTFKYAPSGDEWLSGNSHHHSGTYVQVGRCTRTCIHRIDTANLWSLPGYVNILSIWTTEKWRLSPPLPSIWPALCWYPKMTTAFPGGQLLMNHGPGQDTKGWEHRCHPEKPNREPLNKIFKWLSLSAGRRKFRPNSSQ